MTSHFQKNMSGNRSVIAKHQGSSTTWKTITEGDVQTALLIEICSKIGKLNTRDISHTYKNSPGRLVLPMQIGPKNVVVKYQRHQGLRNLFKASFRYYSRRLSPTTALTEFNNTKIANKLQVPTATMLGYGCNKKKLLICGELLVFEQCPGCIPLIERLTSVDTTYQQKAISLQRAFRLISRMVKTGYIHLDLHSDNILISPSTPDKDIIIDYEYGYRFRPKMMQKVTAFIFGYLYRCQVNEVFTYEEYYAMSMSEIETIFKGESLDSKFPGWFQHAATTRVAKRKRRRYLNNLTPHKGV